MSTQTDHRLSISEGGEVSYESGEVKIDRKIYSRPSKTVQVRMRSVNLIR
jgi:hypothetical protein